MCIDGACVQNKGSLRYLYQHMSDTGLTCDHFYYNPVFDKLEISLNEKQFFSQL